MTMIAMPKTDERHEPTTSTLPGRSHGRRRRPRVPLLVKIAIAAIAFGVLALTGMLPQQLGGSFSYAITDGTSMLPTFHPGDLVIIRKEPSYHVGEVAAFHNEQLGVIVLHRIVAMRGDRYVFKGDNNDFDTSYEPTKSQIVGAEWLHLPGVGNVLLDLRIPVVAALLLAALWLYTFWTPSHSESRRRRRRHAR